MGFTGKSKNSNSSSENWGMGFLLVFFPEDDNSSIFNKKKSLISSPSSSPNSANNIRRSNSSNLILTKTQSTITICALLVFITLLLFTLSTFEPTINNNSNPTISTFSRRHLYEKSNLYTQSNTKSSNSPSSSSSSSLWVTKLWSQKPQYSNLPSHAHALQRMGTLFMRGTRAMNDLIVVHVMDDDSLDQVRVFLRLLHRSGLTSKADVVFLFPRSSTFPSKSSSPLSDVIGKENYSLLKIVARYQELNDSMPGFAGFDVSHFVKFNNEKEENKQMKGESIWGKKNKSNYSESEEAELKYGSVVGFDSDELDPENSLAGFLDHVPMSLRRWACYPMLLGRLRRNYKHIMLVELKNFLVLGDPLVRVRNRNTESVLLSRSSTPKKKNSDETRVMNSGIIMGGSRGIRRFTNAMLTEIVRVAMQHHKGKHSVTESSVLNQLVHNEELILKGGVNIITSAVSIPDTSSLAASLSTNNSDSSSTLSRYPVVQRANSNNNNDFINLISLITKKLCSSPIESSVYSDCNSQTYKDDKL